jgi:C-terminal processing protease CtpA/Prc
MLLEPEDMLEDLEYLSSTIRQVHPAMAGRSPESRSAMQEFAARVDAAKAELSEPLPAWRFFALVNEVLASLRDAHTSLRLPEFTGTLPVQLTWADDGVVVSGVLDPDLPVQPGDELISLGGRTPERLLEDLCAWVPHANLCWVKALGGRYLANPLVLKGLGLVSRQGSEEGEPEREVDRTSGREETVEETVEMVVRRPEDAAGASRVLAAKIPMWDELTVTGTVSGPDAATGGTRSPAAEAGVKPGDRVLAADGAAVRSADDLARAVQRAGREGRTLVLEVLRQGERLELSVRPMPRSAQDAGSTGAAETAYVIGVVLGGAPTSGEKERPWFGWAIDHSGRCGLFWLDECNNTRSYRRAVDEFFSAARKDGVERIAIDLRRNAGGDSMVVGAFLKYLPYEYGDLRAPSRATRYSPQLAKQRGPWLRLLTWMGETFFNGRWLPYPLQPRAAADELFRGEVYVLTSWLSFSSAVDFAAILRDNRLAKVVGAPTGGSPTEYGDILGFAMPNTGWRFSVSTTSFVRPDPAFDPADALYPDIPIPTTVRDIREGRDPVLEWLRSSSAMASSAVLP